jgi:phosphoglycerate dehydrogenase-like enzyme
MPETIIVLDPIAEGTASRLRALLPEGFVLEHGASRDEAHQKAIIAKADYAISGQIAVPAPVLRAAKRLKLLHKWGVGTDNLDLVTAAELGIKVARTTGSNAIPVAEFTLALTLAALRNLAVGHAELKKGIWRGGNFADSYTLSGKTVGMIGFGAVGKRLAQLLAGFGCDIIYNKPRRLAAEEEQRLGVAYAELPALLAASDVVTLHCPLTPQTEGMIDRAALRRMKPGAILVNVARGGIVVEDDLIAALRARDIHGAAMDVYNIEPLPADHPFLTLDNVVVTPHIAAGTIDNFDKTVRHMFGNIVHVKEGRPIPAQDVVVG